jgi:hypothetical protein
MAKEIYNWRSSGKLQDWKLEGSGEYNVEVDGALHVRTYNMGPLRRATNCWLRDLTLPDNYEIEWTYRNGTMTNNPIVGEGVMLIFSALPLVLKDLWEDPRPHARYSDLHSYSKLVCYTCGFFRTPYGLPCQIRKLGGHVPVTWGESNLKDAKAQDFDQLTVFSRGDEPLTEADRGKTVRYRLRKEGARIQQWCNDKLVHDWTDDGKYQYFPEPLKGGKTGIRQFNGYMDNWYSDFIVREV